MLPFSYEDCIKRFWSQHENRSNLQQTCARKIMIIDLWSNKVVLVDYLEKWSTLQAHTIRIIENKSLPKYNGYYGQ